MSETTFFRVEGRTLPERSTLNVKGNRAWIEEVGRNVRLADGTRETLRRPQFLRKLAVTITGEGSVPMPLFDLNFGDVITIDFPHPESVPGSVTIANLDYPPSADRLWYFNAVGKLVPAGSPNIARTMWVPRMTVMIDSFTSEYDDARARYNWTLEAEVV